MSHNGLQDGPHAGQDADEPIPWDECLSAEEKIYNLQSRLATSEAERTENEQLLSQASTALCDLGDEVERLREQLRQSYLLHAEHRRHIAYLEREHEKCPGMQRMLEAQIGRLEEQLRACQQGRLPPCAAGKESGEMVPVDGGALRVLGQQAAQTEEMRRRFQYMKEAETDERFKPGQKATMAALVDICGAPAVGGAFTAPRKVCRAAIAQRTGQSLGTVSRQVPDLQNIGVLKLERREVRRERSLDEADPDAKTTERTEEEWWVSLGPLPPKHVPKEEIQAKCTHARAEAERKKRCPGCGSTSLEALTFRCTCCARTCGAAEAAAAGERLEDRDGRVIDRITGEKLTPLLVSPNGKGHQGGRKTHRRRKAPPTESVGGIRHTTVVHPSRNPLGATSSGSERAGTTSSPSRIPYGGRSAAPAQSETAAGTPLGFREGPHIVGTTTRPPHLAPNGFRGGSGGSERKGEDVGSGPSPPR